MTFLEAINTLLSVIGEAPVASLADTEGNTINDAALASRTLREVDRDVQAEGWRFNTDVAVTIQKDVGGNFPLEGNVLRAEFSPARYPDSQFVVRGKRIYDRQHRTYKIDMETMIIDQMVMQLDWDDLPHAAQQYIAIRAARIYSDRAINSNVIYTYTSQDEQYSRQQLIRAEESSLSNNLLWGNDRGIGQGLGYIPAAGQQYRSN